jgi:Na+-transporting methylmalonyl-CoA/oxaloacetate decarboxylase gamma subunit
MDDIIKLLEVLKDPALMICVVVMYFMNKMLVKKDADLMAVHADCNAAQREDVETLTRLVTMVEILVHGRRLQP